MPAPPSITTAAGSAKVKITARAEYLPDIKIPGGAFCFGYQITVANIGKVRLQLVSRRWEITDGDGETREVRGEGVVGKQPHISPGYAFTYTSYVDLSTPAGSMVGAYSMLAGDTRFNADIPRFSLAVPGAVH
ncbi:MAG: Co2+/Mg2+ efflux protein ApaG [Gammaproteobacteria bacterium]